MKLTNILVLVCLAAMFAPAAQTAPQNYPAPVEDDFVINNFRFHSGEVLPQLRIHYRTIGKPVKDSSGIVRNAVWIGHGTGGRGSGFLTPRFAGVLFGPGQ